MRIRPKFHAIFLNAQKNYIKLYTYLSYCRIPPYFLGTTKKSIICASGRRLRDPAVVPAPRGNTIDSLKSHGPLCVLKQLPLGAAQHPMPKIRHANYGDDGQLIWNCLRLCVEWLLFGWLEIYLVWQSWLWCTGGTKTVLLAQVLKKREHQNQKIKQYFTSLMPQANAWHQPHRSKSTTSVCIDAWYRWSPIVFGLWTTRKISRHGVDMPTCWRTSFVAVLQSRKKNDAMTYSSRTFGNNPTQHEGVQYDKKNEINGMNKFNWDSLNPKRRRGYRITTVWTIKKPKCWNTIVLIDMFYRQTLWNVFARWSIVPWASTKATVLPQFWPRET